MWPFGKKKNKQEENDNPTQERTEELPKEPIKAPVTEIKKSTSSSAFCMGVEGKFLLGKGLFYAGTVKGTVNVGDEICIVNPGDYEISFDDVITFDTPNVVKAKIAKIEVGSEKSSVESVTDSKASIVFDEDMEYYIRTGTVFCSSGSKGEIVRQAYCDGLGNGLIGFAHMNVSDGVYARMSLNDMAEVARMFLGLISRDPAFQSPEMKDEITSKIGKLGTNMSKCIVNEDVIYTLYSKRTGEPKLFTRCFDGPNNTIRIDPPFICIFTEQTYKSVSNAYKDDTAYELRKIENGKDRNGIKKFLDTTFYLNGATGLCVNYIGLTIAAGNIIPPPNYDGVPAIQIPVTNPMVESLILLVGQFEKVETEAEKKEYSAYSNMMFRELAKARFIAPIKIEGDVEHKDNIEAVFKENTTISFVVMDGKYGRPALKVFTDWQKMVEAGFKPEDGWSGNVMRLDQILDAQDCVINATSSMYPTSGIYIGREMFDTQIKQYIE